MKRILCALVMVAFASASILFVASCAKKQVKVEEAAKPAPAEVKKAEAPKVSDDDAKRKAEEERLAKLRELERAQKLRGEILAFEAEHIYFDFDKSEIKPEAQAILKKKADWLRANADFKVKAEGHCDERGTNEYNLALGERRANAASKFMNALGISANRISTISYGEERPCDQGHNEKAWSKNRRDEFKLSR